MGVHFDEIPGGAIASFVMPACYEGFSGIAHGGAVAAVLDDAMWHAIWLQNSLSTVTSKLTVRYRQPTPIGRELVVRGRVTGFKKGMLVAHAELRLAQQAEEGGGSTSSDGLLASAEGVFATMPHHMRDCFSGGEQSDGGQCVR